MSLAVSPRGLRWRACRATSVRPKAPQEPPLTRGWLIVNTYGRDRLDRAKPLLLVDAIDTAGGPCRGRAPVHLVRRRLLDLGVKHKKLDDFIAKALFQSAHVISWSERAT